MAIRRKTRRRTATERFIEEGRGQRSEVRDQRPETRVDLSVRRFVG